MGVYGPRSAKSAGVCQREESSGVAGVLHDLSTWSSGLSPTTSTLKFKHPAAFSGRSGDKMTQRRGTYAGRLPPTRQSSPCWRRRRSPGLGELDGVYAALTHKNGPQADQTRIQHISGKGNAR